MTNVMDKLIDYSYIIVDDDKIDLILILIIVNSFLFILYMYYDYEIALTLEYMIIHVVNIFIVNIFYNILKYCEYIQGL